MSAAGLHLLVTLGGQRVALPATEIDSVVEIEALMAVPLAPPHVAGLAALRSRVLTVIDGRVALGLASARAEGPCEAVMLEQDGHGYALLVDEIVDAVDIEGPVERLLVRPAGAWAAIARGTVEHDGSVLLVISPAGLIAAEA